MLSTDLTPARIMIAMLSLTLMTGSNALHADQQVITDDGREVLIKEDGTWEFRSNDRFANTSDGQRVRLKDDGSWQYVGNAPMSSDKQVRTTKLEIELQKVVIETHEKKVQKNKRVKSQTVIYLKLALSPLADSNVSVNKKDIPLIKVTDSKNRDYPVLSIQPVPLTLSPDSDTTVTIRVDGAPQWWKNVKSMQIEFKPGVLGLKEAVKLSRNVDEIEKKKVDGFEKNE
jgi:hypothetical protein